LSDNTRWWPTTPVVEEVLEQALTEFDRQKRDGWHLIEVEVKAGVDEEGRTIWQDARYLETECPIQN